MSTNRRPRKRQKTGQQPLPMLPDLPTIKIFSHLPMQELYFRVPQVCEQWRALHPEACHNRTHLALSINKPQDYYERLFTDSDFTPFDYFLPVTVDVIEYEAHNDYDFPGTVGSRLCCRRFSRLLLKNLVYYFPRVESLEIAQSVPSSATFYQLSWLIEQWSKTLTTLRMWTWWETEEDASPRKVANFMRLFRSINSCRKLKHFTFFANDYIWEIPEHVPPGFRFPDLNLTILSHLETFQFSTSDNPGVLFQSFATYGQANNDLKVLQLGNPIQHDVSQGPQLSTAFLERFHSITLTIFYPTLLDLCFKCQNLRNLEIDFSQELNILQFFQRLQSLRQLKSLKIYFSVTFSLLLAEFDRVNAEDLPRLPSIEVLKLEITASTHRVFHSRHLAHFFPSIDKVDIVHFMAGCTTCAYGDVYRISKARLMKCTQIMLNNWKKCPSLKYIRLRPDSNEKKFSRKDNRFIRYSSLVDRIEYERPTLPKMHRI